MEATATLPGQTPLQIGSETGQNVPTTSAGAPPSTNLSQSAGNAFPSVSEIFNTPLVRKAMPGIVIVVSLMLFMLAYLWIQDSGHRALYPEMSDSDRQAAYDALRAADFNVKVDSSTGVISVPVGRYYEARMLLASSGLPREANTTAVDALSSDSSMMTSQFMEQARYSAAIESELAKSIVKIATIDAARVHLATTKRSPFMRRKAESSASVILVPHAGRTVSNAQVQAITHLVSSSVPYLSADNVVVVDQMGNLLTQDEGSIGQVVGVFTEYERDIEEQYRSRINAILGPLVGVENIRAEVDVAVDFTQLESTYENFDRDNVGGETRSESINTERETVDAGGGIPGATSMVLESANAPQADEGEGSDDRVSSSSTTRNYELDKETTYIKQPGGSIERLSVAVVVNEEQLLLPLQGGDPNQEGAQDDVAREVDQTKLARLENLVRGVVGFDESRGDNVTLVASTFDIPDEIINTTKWYESHYLLSVVQVIAGLLVFGLLMQMVVRPVLGHFLSGGVIGEIDPVTGLPLDAVAGADGAGMVGDDGLLEMGEGETLEDIKAKLKPKKSSISPEMLDTANTYDDKVALVRLLVSEDSGRVANVLKKMVSPE